MFICFMQTLCCLDCHECKDPRDVNVGKCTLKQGFTSFPEHTAQEHELLLLATGILAALAFTLRLVSITCFVQLDLVSYSIVAV